jgi:hypothetical protein
MYDKSIPFTVGNVNYWTGSWVIKLGNTDLWVQITKKEASKLALKIEGIAANKNLHGEHSVFIVSSETDMICISFNEFTGSHPTEPDKE